MNVTEAIDTTKGNEYTDALSNETPEETEENLPSFTFSSDRFIFNTFAEDARIDCIDKVGGLLAGFRKKPPTLREALESMGYGEKTEELHKTFTDKATEKSEEIDAPGLSVEDIAVIFCYTYEWDEERLGNEIDSPYRKLNKSISVDRRNPVLKKTRAFLFLLLQGLRKLPRYTPENRTLYRGIRAHIQTGVGSERHETKTYTKGNEKTWWTFTSTSEDLGVTKNFVENNEKKGTLFTLSGEAWGYDISVFSNYPDEKEILLEPERRLSIESVKMEGAIIAVNAEILDTPLVLKDYIRVKVVRIKERKSRFKEVPQDLRVELVTESTVTLSWDAPEVNDDKVVSYQVSARQTTDKFINRSSENTCIVKKDETKCAVVDLVEGKEYEFRVRCKYNDGWGKEWSEKKVVKMTFDSCVWKRCPDDVYEKRKYSVDEGNLRIATNINNDWCTIIGNTSVPPNKVTSWSIKVLKSKNDNGDGIFIGVAPSNINQNNDNYEGCGWYFGCYHSTLVSGPPHKYSWKEYGPRKRWDGEYVHTGDRVGAVMNTTKGDLSFILNGVNRSVAYERVPLDQPLVPCVILKWKGDSVELII